MTNQTKEKLRDLGLRGMLRAYEESTATPVPAEWSLDELLARLVDAECDDRHGRRVGRALKRSRLRTGATLTDVDTGGERGLDRTLIRRLGEGTWLKQAQNLFITGMTGTGKTYLCEALAHQACNLEYRVLYFTCTKFFRYLRESQADNSFGTRMKQVSRYGLLVIDDFALEPFTEEHRRWLWEVVDDRQGSTILASQVPVKHWREVIGDPTFADSIMDRLEHRAHKIELKPEKRSRRAQKEALLP
jgi:DNA replication protein DnaC